MEEKVMDYVCKNYQITKEKETDRTATLAAYGTLYAKKKAEVSRNASKEGTKNV